MIAAAATLVALGSVAAAIGVCAAAAAALFACRTVPESAPSPRAVGVEVRLGPGAPDRARDGGELAAGVDPGRIAHADAERFDRHRELGDHARQRVQEPLGAEELAGARVPQKRPRVVG
jgi:hypothetical protein